MTVWGAYSFYTWLTGHGWPPAAAKTGTAIAYAATALNDQYREGDIIGPWGCSAAAVEKLGYSVKIAQLRDTFPNVGANLSRHFTDWSEFPTAYMVTDYTPKPAHLSGLVAGSPAANALPQVTAAMRAQTDPSLGGASAGSTAGAWSRVQRFAGLWGQSTWADLQNTANAIGRIRT